MNDMSASFTPDLRDWIAKRVSEDQFASEQDYLAALVQRDKQAELDDIEWVKAKLKEGEESGFTTVDPESFFRDLKAGIFNDHARR